MKLIKWMKHLGEGMCEIDCEKCGRPFYHDLQCKHNNGMCVCPSCGNVWPERNVEGINISEESRKAWNEYNPETGEKINE